MSNPVPSALPFWLSLLFAPIIAIAAWFGGWTLALGSLYGLILMTLLDGVFGSDPDSPDPDTDAALFWHRLVLYVWVPTQIVMIFGAIAWCAMTEHLAKWEEILLMVNVGIASGGIGMVYAHELIHQKNRLERRLGEILLATMLYGHFATEHLQVHHRHVGTPQDAATARYNEGLYHFLGRCIPGSFISAWRAEVARLERLGKPAFDVANPFWRYIGAAFFMLALAYAIGAWHGVTLFLVQTAMAIVLLEQVNYVEHYGLVRKRLPNGKYERVHPHHSWNADHRVSNYLLINLQRHSDHHIKPDRRYPLLQNYGAHHAPRLPYGYPLMLLISTNPWLWRRMMNPRVRKWRSLYYPEITDWRAA